MACFKLTLAYDGTKFSGWQAQPGRRTVAGTLAAAWQKVTGEAPVMTATSRTDAGVHAFGQVVGVGTETHLSAEQLLAALNANLPEDALLQSVETAPPGFHATFDAVGKRYRYQIYNHRQRPLWQRNYVWHVPQALDQEAMHRAAQQLVGKHDFASFQSAGSPRPNTVRTIRAVEVKPGEADCLWIEVEGDGFLYRMVRNIVGSLIEPGTGRRSETWLAEVLAARDRRAAGMTAPPQGLFLLGVDYGE